MKPKVNPRDYCLLGLNSLNYGGPKNQKDHLHLIPYSIIFDFYDNLSDRISAIRFAIFLLHSPLQIFDKDFGIPS